MQHHRFLIIGGGMAAAAAVRGIRDVDADGPIGLISEESDSPYNRPPLSKGLWKGDSIDGIWSELDNQGVMSYLGRSVAALDPDNKRVTDAHGTVYSFDKLLLATGGTPDGSPSGTIGSSTSAPLPIIAGYARSPTNAGGLRLSAAASSPPR